MKQHTGKHYALAVLLWLGLAVLLGSQPLASAFPYPPANWLEPLLDAPTHVSIPYLVGALVLLLLGSFYTYLRHLTPMAFSRPALLVFLNAFAPSLFAGLAVVAYDYGESGSMPETRVFGWLSLYVAPAVALAPPLLLLLAERLLAAISRKIGLVAMNRGWRRLALRQLRASLRWRPTDRAIRRQCGLLHAEEDDCTETIAMLEPLGPLAESEDEESLRALERCYRVSGDIEAALACLLRLQTLRPEQANYEKRILEDYLALGRREEALALLEAGNFRPTLDLLLLRQKLNVELGNFAQALSQIRLIAEQEGPPHTQSIRLYRDLIERLPEHLEVRINLGLLLLEEQAEEGRREGAAMLEEALAEDPRRLYLDRSLIDYYQESGKPGLAREHRLKLVAAGDPDPELYLCLAQQSLDEEENEAAVEILQRMLEILPEDWRGHQRMGRALFQRGELEPAEAEYQRAVELAGDASDPALQSLGESLAQRRRERALASMEAALNDKGADQAQRLAMIEHLIGLGRIDQALVQCEQLLDEAPDRQPEVERLLLKGIEQNARSYRLRDYLSDLYFQAGRYDEMLAMCREMAAQSLNPAQVMSEGCLKILARVPDHAEARAELALARRGAEDWPGVIAALDPLMDAPGDPLSPEDKALWVEAAYRLDRLPDAARVGLTLADDLAAEAGFMLMLIDILQAEGDYDSAYTVYRKAKVASPDNERLRRLERRVTTNQRKHRLASLQKRLEKQGELTAQEHYEKAELHRDLGEVEEAIVHFQRAADEETLADLALAKMAVTLCERGMYDLAEETLEPLELTRESVAEHPELLGLLYAVARALEKIRRPDLAVKYYKRIFRVDASFEDVVERLQRLS